MDYIPHTANDRAEMLKVVGVESIEALFDAVPAAQRFPRMALPPAISEMEIMRDFLERASKMTLRKIGKIAANASYKLTWCSRPPPTLTKRK